MSMEEGERKEGTSRVYMLLQLFYFGTPTYVATIEIDTAIKCELVLQTGYPWSKHSGPPQPHVTVVRTLVDERRSARSKHARLNPLEALPDGR